MEGAKYNNCGMFRLECFAFIFVSLWGRKNRQYQGSINFNMGWFGMKNLIHRNGSYWLFSRHTHYFVMRPIVTRVALISLKLRRILKVLIAFLLCLLEAWSFYLLLPVVWLLLVVFRDNTHICSLHWDNFVDYETKCAFFSSLSSPFPV